MKKMNIGKLPPVIIRNNNGKTVSVIEYSKYVDVINHLNDFQEDNNRLMIHTIKLQIENEKLRRKLKLSTNKMRDMEDE
jgi:regulator of replication initiation timing